MAEAPKAPAGEIVSLATDFPVWDRFFTVSPLVIVGTREGEHGYDLAPKSMAMPLGWQNYYCFVCSPRHGTYANIAERGEFTVSFPRPDQIVQASLAAAAREADDSKPSLAALATFPARAVDGVLVEGCYVFLECTLDRIIDGFGENSLIIGRVVAASVDEHALREAERDDNELVRDAPLLAYVSPGRFAALGESLAFPFPAEFKL